MEPDDDLWGCNVAIGRWAYQAKKEEEQINVALFVA